MYLFGIITKSDKKELVKSGYKCVVYNGKTFNKILDPTQNCKRFKSSKNKVLVGVWVDENLYDNLSHRIAINKGTKQMEALINLRHRREDLADKYYEKDKELRALGILDSDGWELDGEDRMIRKFYYDAENIGEAEFFTTDSLCGSYIVDFESGKARVKDTHINT